MVCLFFLGGGKGRWDSKRRYVKHSIAVARSTFSVTRNSKDMRSMGAWLNKFFSCLSVWFASCPIKI